jgi:hypothetical protein
MLVDYNMQKTVLVIIFFSIIALPLKQMVEYLHRGALAYLVRMSLMEVVD